MDKDLKELRMQLSAGTEVSEKPCPTNPPVPTKVRIERKRVVSAFIGFALVVGGLYIHRRRRSVPPPPSTPATPARVYEDPLFQAF